MFSGKDFTPAKIQEVQENSPALISGLKKEDIILSINNNKVKSLLEVSTYINTSTSDTINLLILRNNQEINFKVKLHVFKSKFHRFI